MHNINLYIAQNLKAFLNIIHVWNVYTFRNNTCLAASLALYLYIEYTVKIISILNWMPVMHNIDLYIAQILKDLLNIHV